MQRKYVIPLMLAVVILVPQTPPPTEEKSYEDKIREKYGITDELWEQHDFPESMYGGLS